MLHPANGVYHHVRSEVRCRHIQTRTFHMRNSFYSTAEPTTNTTSDLNVDYFIVSVCRVGCTLMYAVVAGEICGQYIVHASVYVYVYKIFIKTMCARMYICSFA